MNREAYSFEWKWLFFFSLLWIMLLANFFIGISSHGIRRFHNFILWKKVYEKYEKLIMRSKLFFFWKVFLDSVHKVVLVLSLSSEIRLLFSNKSLSFFSFRFFGFWPMSFVFSFFPCSLLFLVLNCQQYLTRMIIMMTKTTILAAKPKMVHMLLKKASAVVASQVNIFWLNVLSLLQVHV